MTHSAILNLFFSPNTFRRCFTSARDVSGSFNLASLAVLNTERAKKLFSVELGVNEKKLSLSVGELRTNSKLLYLAFVCI